MLETIEYIMKVSGFCALFLAIGAAMMFFNFLSPSVVSCFPDFVATTTSSSDDNPILIAVSRKLKENGSGIRNNNNNNKVDNGDMALDDYHPTHPPPGSCSGEIFHPHPIQHGTPLNPYIPKPPPSPPPPSNPN